MSYHSITSASVDAVVNATVHANNGIAAGVDCIVNVCSFCHLQYEVSQAQLNKELGEKKYQIPVIYYTQLLGLAMGIDPDELGLGKHMVSTQPFLDKIFG